VKYILQELVKFYFRKTILFFLTEKVDTFTVTRTFTMNSIMVDLEKGNLASDIRLLNNNAINKI
jgi:hypothetical protein